MWTCAICNEDTDDDAWESCWKCGNRRTTDPDAAGRLKQERERQLARFRTCGKCDSPMLFDGIREYREDIQRSILGGLDFNRENYAVYHCPRCGKVDFYLAELGGEFRRDDTAPTAPGDDDR